jgi:hypothetical protein
MDNAFSSDTQPMTGENIPETSVTETARRGRWFFFWS